MIGVMSQKFSAIEPMTYRRPTVNDVPDDWFERQLASQQRYNEETRDMLARHLEQPWHLSFTPQQADMQKRMERIESTLIGIGRWTIGALFLIVGVLAAILGVAWKILETKPPV